MITLYHVTSRRNARSILRRGFKNRKGHFLTERVHRGVWLSDRPLLDCNEGISDGSVVLQVTLKVRRGELANYEWIEQGKPYREWLLPAAMIRARGTIRLF